MTAPNDDILDLLAAYALDALAPDEIARLYQLLDEHPELRATAFELRATASRLPYGLPEAIPPPELRQRALDYATGRAARRPRAPARPSVGRGRGWLLGLSGFALAAVVAAAIGWGQVFSLRTELAQTRTELVRAYEDLSTVQQVLASLQGSTGNGAMVRTGNGATVLVVKLPQLQAGRTYQLWQIRDNTPASVGLFSVDQQGFGVFKVDQPLQRGETVAVTDEPDGGSPQPTTIPLIAGPVQT